MRAAIELRDGVELDVRIGVNTGEVVTGTGDTLVTGDAVNIAARLEQAAGRARCSSAAQPTGSCATPSRPSSCHRSRRRGSPNL